MWILVCFKGAWMREELVAVMARINLLPCVDPLVCFKGAWLREELVSHGKNKPSPLSGTSCVF